MKGFSQFFSVGEKKRAGLTVMILKNASNARSWHLTNCRGLPHRNNSRRIFLLFFRRFTMEWSDALLFHTRFALMLPLPCVCEREQNPRPRMESNDRVNCKPRELVLFQNCTKDRWAPENTTDYPYALRFCDPETFKKVTQTHVPSLIKKTWTFSDFSFLH